MSDITENKNNEAPEAFNGVYYLREGTEKKLLSLLGFASRARKLVCGSDLCRDAIRRGTTTVTIVAGDASANTKKRIIDACKYYEGEMCITKLTAAELSHQIGKTGDIAVIGVTEINFANGIKALFDEHNI